MPDPNRKPRWRLRFSLRTLLIFVLLIGSGALLWWNSAAFAPALTIDEQSQIINAEFSPDDSQFLTCTAEPYKGNHKYHVKFYDAKSARLNHTRSMTGFEIFGYGERPSLTARFSDSGRYVHLFEMSTSGPIKASYYDIATGVKLAPAGQFLTDDESRAERHTKLFLMRSPFGEPYYSSQAKEWLVKTSPRDNFGLMENDSCAHIVKLPDRQLIKQYDDTGSVTFSPDEKWAVVTSTDELVHIIALEDGRVVSRLKLDAEKNYDLYQVCISPTEPIFAVEVRLENPLTELYDMLTGKKVAEYPGRPTYRPFSPDGKRFVTIESTGKPPPDPIHGNRDEDKSERANVWELGSRSPPVVVEAHITEFFQTGAEVRAFPTGVYDSHTGLLLHRERIFYARNGVLAAKYPAPDAILLARTAEPVFRFSKSHWPAHTPATQINVAFANRSNAFLTWDRVTTTEGEAPAPGNRRVTLWRQTRPFAWYGLAWLPEFWLVVVLAILLVCNLWRDRRVLRSKPAGPK